MPISTLPPEILAEVFAYLQDADVFSGRLTSRYLERASFAHFGKRFFRKKGYMIITPSLRVLQQIAAHKELSKYPQHIWFNPDCYTFVKPACAPEDEDSDLDSADELETPYEKSAEVLAPANAVLAQQYAAYQECVQDHTRLLWRDGLEPELIKAFRNLPNLQTVGMRRSDFYSPYGWTILEKTIGEDPREIGPLPSHMPGDHLSGSTQLFVALLYALAASNVKLQRLYTDAVEVDITGPTSLPPTNILTSACSSILYLELNVVKAGITPLRPGPFSTMKVRKQNHSYMELPPGTGLAELFAATPNIKELGLQIFRNKKQPHMVPPRPRDPSSWKESYPFLALSYVANTTIFAFLTRIKLEKVTVTSSILLSLLKPCASKLTSIKMRDIRLLCSDVDSEPRPWGTVFSWLAGSCPELDYILFYHILYDHGGVSFASEPPLANHDDVQIFVEQWSPPHVEEEVFMKYDRLNLEVRGRQEVNRRLRDAVEKHWYQGPLFSYAMEEELWHTDTSDEEW